MKTNFNISNCALMIKLAKSTANDSPYWPTYVAMQKKASYSITSSAMARSAGGIVTPSALAVLRLMANSNVVGASVGKSGGWCCGKFYRRKLPRAGNSRE